MITENEITKILLETLKPTLYDNKPDIMGIELAAQKIVKATGEKMMQEALKNQKETIY